MKYYILDDSGVAVHGAFSSTDLEVIFKGTTPATAPIEAGVGLGSIWSAETGTWTYKSNIRSIRTIDEVRADRDILLRDTDYTQIPGFPGINVSEFATYRQELRDLPDSFIEGNEVQFPLPPGVEAVPVP